MIPFLDLNAQYREVGGALEEAAVRVLRSGRYVSGAEVEAFEGELAAFCGVGHAVGVDSGTSAISLALAALGIGAGHEVITAAHTFVATVEAILAVGARPVLVDVDGRSGLIDPAAVERAITARTRAIVPVHIYGQLAAMDRLTALARASGLVLVEDAAQAIGTRQAGRHAGTSGQAATFSFYAGKNLGAVGEAGAVITDDADLAARIAVIRNHGQSTKYEHVARGWNSRMDEIQAACLRVKLGQVESWNQARRGVAARYREGLRGSSVRLLPEQAGVVANHHVFPVFDGDRDGLRAALDAAGIQTGIHYPRAVHQYEPYASLRPEAASLANAEEVCRTTLSLPMFAEMTTEQVDAVCAEVTRLRPAV